MYISHKEYKELFTNTIIMQILTIHLITWYNNNSKYQFMVSEALDSQNNSFKDFFKDFTMSDCSGFKGPYVCWAVLWICGLTINFRIIVWLPCEHSETQTRHSSSPSCSLNFSWGAAQARCRSAALPSDYITTPVAFVQHCIVAEEQHRGAAGSSSSSREAEEHLSGMCVA